MSSSGTTPRRKFLHALALAPAAVAASSALAACATSASAARAATSAPAAGEAAAAAPAGGDALAAVRQYPLALEDEPACVFSALPVRPE